MGLLGYIKSSFHKGKAKMYTTNVQIEKWEDRYNVSISLLDAIKALEVLRYAGDFSKMSEVLKFIKETQEKFEQWEKEQNK